MNVRSATAMLGPPLAVSAAVLLWSAYGVPALPGGPPGRAVGTTTAAAVLLVLARRAGLGWYELGLARSTWRAGLRWAGRALTVTALGYLVLLAVPAGRDGLVQLGDQATSPSDLAMRALVLIPLGTVLAEELTFRGVLLALIRRRMPELPALACTSAVFGCWHLPPALRAGETAMGATGVVLVTMLGGLVLGRLRQHTGSLLAPGGLHLAVNSLGLGATALARQLDP